MSQRSLAALELLESERVYVSCLSLLLKANITYNSCENTNLKEQRMFPSALRFLIQQHLELLHLLQERVLKNHWQGILGDVFLRFSSTERDFLDNYVSYLKELPECLSAASLFSMPVGLLEDDITGDEPHPPLHTLLLQPVQRIPEYLRLLQSLLCQTESEHPDYYLLVVCVQHLRSFTTQYSDLLQHHQRLLTHSHTHSVREPEHTHNLSTHQPDRTPLTHKELSRSSLKPNLWTFSSTSVRHDPAHGQSRKKAAVRCYSNWEAEPNRCHPDIFFASDSESHHETPPTQRHKIPETERTSSLLAFLPYRDRDSHCSSHSHSTDSSVDVAFVTFNPSNNPDRRGRRRRGGVNRHARGCMSPDSASVMQPVQRKSKSLNGLRLDTIDGHAHLVRRPAHPRLERQSAQRNDTQERHHDLDTHPVAEEGSRSPVWEELKRKGGSNDGDHAPPTEQSRKESKGFRSSFKKLFKKRSGGQSKVDKAVLKAEGQSSSELETGRSNREQQPGNRDRGTAV